MLYNPSLNLLLFLRLRGVVFLDKRVNFPIFAKGCCILSLRLFNPQRILYGHHKKRTVALHLFLLLPDRTYYQNSMTHHCFAISLLLFFVLLAAPCSSPKTDSENSSVTFCTTGNGVSLFFLHVATHRP